MLKFRRKKYINLSLGLIGTIRAYNLIFYTLALYFSYFFVFNSLDYFFENLTNYKIHFLLLAAVFSIASGYIINSYYDLEKDLINKPKRTYISKKITTEESLRLYLTLCFLVSLMSLFVGFSIFIFYNIYLFLLWFYSHKLKRIVILNNLISVILAIFPFFISLVFLQKFNIEYSIHAVYLITLFLLIDLSKDFITQKGDLIMNYATIPLVFGEKKAKLLLLFIICIGILTVFFILKIKIVGLMKFYFLFSSIVLCTSILYLIFSKNKKNYFYINLLFKFLLLSGILFLPLIVF